MKQHVLIYATGFVALIAAAATVAPCMADPARERSVEDTLLNDPRPRQVAPGETRRDDVEGRVGTSGFVPARVGGRSFWAEELGMAGVSGDVLPLVSVAERMRDVQNSLGRADCGTATQHAQRQILDSLDQLLQQAQQSCAGAAGKPCEGQPSGAAPSGDKPAGGQKPGTKQGTGSNNSSKVATAADDRPQDDSPRVDAARMRVLMKRLWGELPPQRREQMLQLPVEEFLPRYELMIEDYFRRLSEEKRTRETRP